MITEDAIKDAIEIVKVEIARNKDLMEKYPIFDNPFNRGILDGYILLLKNLEKEDKSE